MYAYIYIYIKRLFYFQFPLVPGAGVSSMQSLCYLLWRKQDALVGFIVSLLYHRVLSQGQPTRSPRPAFTLTAELFIKGEKRAGDLANFSMGLLAVLAFSCPMKRQAPKIGLKMTCRLLCSIYSCKNGRRPPSAQLKKKNKKKSSSQWLIDLCQSGQILCLQSWRGISCSQGHRAAMCGSLNQTLADLLSALTPSDASSQRLKPF